MRLIDADALIAHIKKRIRNEMVIAWLCRMIGEVTNIKAEQVKQGEWLDVEYNPFWKTMLATCSSCSVRGEVRFNGNECGFVIPDSPRCPSCGAKMDGDEHDTK